MSEMSICPLCQGRKGTKSSYDSCPNNRYHRPDEIRTALGAMERLFTWLGLSFISRFFSRLNLPPKECPTCHGEGLYWSYTKCKLCGGKGKVPAHYLEEPNDVPEKNPA